MPNKVLYSSTIRFAIFCAYGSPRRSAHKIHNCVEIVPVGRDFGAGTCDPGHLLLTFGQFTLSERSSARPPAERNIVPLASITAKNNEIKCTASG